MSHSSSGLPGGFGPTHTSPNANPSSEAGEKGSFKEKQAIVEALLKNQRKTQSTTPLSPADNKASISERKSQVEPEKVTNSDPSQEPEPKETKRQTITPIKQKIANTVFDKKEQRGPCRGASILKENFVTRHFDSCRARLRFKGNFIKYNGAIGSHKKGAKRAQEILGASYAQTSYMMMQVVKLGKLSRAVHLAKFSPLVGGLTMVFEGIKTYQAYQGIRKCRRRKQEFLNLKNLYKNQNTEKARLLSKVASMGVKRQRITAAKIKFGMHTTQLGTSGLLVTSLAFFRPSRLGRYWCLHRGYDRLRPLQGRQKCSTKSAQRLFQQRPRAV